VHPTAYSGVFRFANPEEFVSNRTSDQSVFIPHVRFSFEKIEHFFWEDFPTYSVDGIRGVREGQLRELMYL